MINNILYNIILPGKSFFNFLKIACNIYFYKIKVSIFHGAISKLFISICLLMLMGFSFQLLYETYKNRIIIIEVRMNTVPST